jgi:hypothetical protein
MNRIALAAALVLTSVAGAHADYFGSNSTADIDARRAQEIRRIEHGRATGQLSPREYNYLVEQQRQIARDERRAKSDGYVSPAERARLNAEVSHASADISRLKHNTETAYGHRPWYRRWWY